MGGGGGFAWKNPCWYDKNLYIPITVSTVWLFAFKMDFLFFYIQGKVLGHGWGVVGIPYCFLVFLYSKCINTDKMGKQRKNKWLQLYLIYLAKEWQFLTFFWKSEPLYLTVGPNFNIDILIFWPKIGLGRWRHCTKTLNHDF